MDWCPMALLQDYSFPFSILLVFLYPVIVPYYISILKKASGILTILLDIGGYTKD
jgi:hypothetical protein